jgi:hypothetical protein
MSKKPGVMIYYDVKQAVDKMSDKHAGILLRAILEFGFEGTIPQLPDKLNLIWPMIQMRLQLDDHRYHQLYYKRRYAAHVRWSNDKGLEPLSYEAWLETDEGRKRPLDD